MNEALKQLYDAALKRIVSLDLPSQPAKPLLMRVSAPYENARCEIMIVGQETGRGDNVPMGNTFLIFRGGELHLSGGSVYTVLERQ